MSASEFHAAHLRDRDRTLSSASQDLWVGRPIASFIAESLPRICPPLKGSASSWVTFPPPGHLRPTSGPCGGDKARPPHSAGPQSSQRRGLSQGLSWDHTTTIQLLCLPHPPSFLTTERRGPCLMDLLHPVFSSGLASHGLRAGMTLWLFVFRREAERPGNGTTFPTSQLVSALP